MRFLSYGRAGLKLVLNECNYQVLVRFTKYINDVAPGRLQITKINSTKKDALVNYLAELLEQDKNVIAIFKKLTSTPISTFLYGGIVWENTAFETELIVRDFAVDLPEPKGNIYGVSESYLSGILSLILRATSSSSQFYIRDELDILTMDKKLISVLKVLLPIPDDYELKAVDFPDETEFSYSNEAQVFNFISVASDMLSNNLVEFGKAGEKPLGKSLNILKASTGINEFYSEKKMDTFATDMLTRSFSYYYWASKKFKKTELASLKDFVEGKFQDKYYFFITRVLLSHLKKVRFDNYNGSEHSLFSALTAIIEELPQESWVSMENILKYSKYRDLKVHLEYEAKTDNYIFSAEDGEYSCGSHYYPLFFEPVIKGGFFYLASLGLFEIKYNKPMREYVIKAKGKEYISLWDSLRYVKITALGKYVFGLSESYEQKAIQKVSKKLKFDTYKPIITIEASDSISQAKLEPYTEKYDDNRYILSHAKIFKDCKNTKALSLKIEAFYKQIEKNPPEVFKAFFDEIKANQNLLRRDLKQVVIELNNNKKLLNLFMKNKKLQELVIKAEGFRVIILKENLAKFTKIVKENGFFLEF